MRIKSTVLKCPHCGNTIPGNQFEFFYGSPLRTCNKCKKEYLDNRYHEIAIEGIREQDINPTDEDRKGNKKGGLVMILLAIASLVLFIILAAVTGWAFYVLLIATVFLFIGGISSIKGSTKKSIEKKRKTLEAEKIQSQQRMNNPEYIARLRAMGYNFPAAPAQSAASDTQ